MNAEKLLERGTMSLLQSEPFFATLLLQMKRVAVGPDVCEMAATDGKSLFYNPAGVEGLKFDVVRTILAHEVCHVAYQHHTRMGGKDPKLANMAGDHVVNLILKQSGFTPWEGWLCDQRFEGQTFEQVYSTLAQEEKQQPQGGGGKQPPPQGQPGKVPPGGTPQPQPGGKPGTQPGAGKPQPQAASTPGGLGQIVPCPPDQVQAQEQEWKMAVEQAASAARAAGKLPGHLARLVEELRESKVPWADLLRQFLANQIPTDFTWSRPSKRTLSQGIYLPSQVKEGLGELVFSIDTSGSIKQKELTAFCSEVNIIVEDLKPSRVTVLYHDTKVRRSEEFLPGEPITFNARGGGGTDFRPVFSWVDELDVLPKAVVMFTDLCGQLPNEEPNYPTLWCCTGKRVAAWGETVRLEA